MTDKQIITILECCASDENIECCKKCALCEKYDCYSEISKNVLDLLNRQKAEIERLYRIIADKDYSFAEVTSALRLAKELLETEKSEAIKEFAERLKESFAAENFNTPDERWCPESEFVAIIDYYVKEMTEVEK